MISYFPDLNWGHKAELLKQTIATDHASSPQYITHFLPTLFPWTPLPLPWLPARFIYQIKPFKEQHTWMIAIVYSVWHVGPSLDELTLKLMSPIVDGVSKKKKKKILSFNLCLSWEEITGWCKTEIKVAKMEERIFRPWTFIGNPLSALAVADP